MKLDMNKIAEFASGSVNKFTEIQKQLTATGEGDEGRVRVVITGEYAIKEVNISPDVIARHRPEQIGPIIVTAYNRAKAAMDRKVQEAMMQLASEKGIDLSSFGG
jgi:DNA-binding protein YbaB